VGVLRVMSDSLLLCCASCYFGRSLAWLGVLRELEVCCLDVFA
jgi:hypothetical protein